MSASRSCSTAAPRSTAPTSAPTAGTWRSAPIEPQFFARLIAGLGLSADDVPSQFELGRYDEMKAIFTERFATRTREEWTEVFAGTDACVTPVLTWTEAAEQRAPAARSTLMTSRRQTGRTGAAVLPDPARTGRNAAEGHHGRRRDRLVASLLGE